MKRLLDLMQSPSAMAPAKDDRFSRLLDVMHPEGGAQPFAHCRAELISVIAPSNTAAHFYSQP